MKRFGILVFLLMIYSVPVVWSQVATPANANPAIHGHGTPGTIPKFVGHTKIGDSIISESNGIVNVNGELDTNLSIPDHWAAFVFNSAESGDPMGLLGVTVSADRGIGVRGKAANPLGNGIGVLGEADGQYGVAVYGNALASSGEPAGVLGVANSSDGGTGVRGVAAGQNGVAVAGEETASSGDPIGVLGTTSSSDRGIGVRGQAVSATGTGIGVLGEASSPSGTAGVFNNGGGGNILQGISALGGEPGYRFRVDGTGRVFANGGFQAWGADFAESMAVSGDRSRYEPGDLLVIDRSGHRRLVLSESAYSTLVAGIHSTKPGMLASPYTMDDPNLAKEVPMAVVGIVPCKVSAENGAIEVGDLLVTSSTPGHAMKGTDRSKMLGAVVAKALEPLQEGKGLIQVLVTLQ